MGTDIYAVAQVKIDGKWVDIATEFDDGRHYNLFAHIAGVRNGTGFGGIPTGDAVNPIQERRGLPNDFDIEDEDYHNGHWMGDHSHGWITSSEVMSHDWDQGYSCGVISIDAYKEWDGMRPKAYCGMISGKGVFLAESENKIEDNTTHVKVSWKRSRDEFQYFIDEIRSLHEKHGEFRIVFGFAS